MAPLGFAIAGCGGMIGGVHAAALKEIPDARLVGAWSRSAEKTRRFAEQHRVRAYASYDELLGDPRFEAMVADDRGRERVERAPRRGPADRPPGGPGRPVTGRVAEGRIDRIAGHDPVGRVLAPADMGDPGTVDPDLVLA